MGMLSRIVPGAVFGGVVIGRVPAHAGNNQAAGNGGKGASASAGERSDAYFKTTGCGGWKKTS
ncbi:hypothetical protein AAW14_14825 [Streptomyces hygroscopicus]|nr:hypothetical protein [Streptomyces hygroscopicus]